MGGGDQLDQVLVTDLVAGQQHQVVINIAHSPRALFLLQARSGSDIRLATEDGFDAGLLGSRVELDRPEHVAMIGHGDSGEV